MLMLKSLRNLAEVFRNEAASNEKRVGPWIEMDIVLPRMTREGEGRRLTKTWTHSTKGREASRQLLRAK